MGFIDELKRIARPYEDVDTADDFEDGFDDEDTGVQTSSRKSEPKREPSYYSSGSDRRSDKVVNIHNTQLKVVLVSPTRFENAAEIADHLREKRTVVLNLEKTDDKISRRLLDFLSGVAYATDGKIKKVAISTYIITPLNVDVTGDLVDELENNGMYF